MSPNGVTQAPQMRIRLPPELRDTVSYLLSTKDVRGRVRRKGEAALDNWSWAHVVSGAGLALTGVSWMGALGMLVGFEAVEALLRRVHTKERWGVFEYESWPNVIADVVTGMVGFAAGRFVVGKPLARAALSSLLPLLPKGVR